MFFNRKKEKIDSLPLSIDLQSEIGDLSNIVANKSIDIINYSNPDTKDLEKLIHKLQVENLDLQNEVGYYERYIKFLEDNYIFILKSLDCAKDLYNKIGEQNEKFD